ncbi:unnamed protein product, partial [Pleuronectes platessa]
MTTRHSFEKPQQVSRPPQEHGTPAGSEEPKGGSHQTLEPRRSPQEVHSQAETKTFFFTIPTTAPQLIIPAEETMFHPVEEQDESVPIRPSRRRCNQGTSATELERPRSFTGLLENPRATRKQHREGH